MIEECLVLEVGDLYSNQRQRAEGTVTALAVGGDLLGSVAPHPGFSLWMLGGQLVEPSSKIFHLGLQGVKDALQPLGVEGHAPDRGSDEVGQAGGDGVVSVLHTVLLQDTHEGVMKVFQVGDVVPGVSEVLLHYQASPLEAGVLGDLHPDLAGEDVVQAVGDLGDLALLPFPLTRPRHAGGYEGVVDILVQQNPESPVEPGDIKQGVVEILGLVLQGGQDLHYQLVRYPVAVHEEGRPVVVEQQEANPAASVEETVSLEAPVGLDIEGYLREPGDPLQHLAGPYGGVDVLRERRGELVVVGGLFFGG